MNQIENYTVIDLEMTGLAAKVDQIIEIGAVKVRDGKIVDTYGTLVNPKTVIPPKVTELTGITTDMVKSAKDLDLAMEEFLEFIGDDILVGHNLVFDYGFMKQWAVNHKRPLEKKAMDTLKIARMLLPREQSKKLEALCGYFHIKRDHAHRALDDAIETKELWDALVKLAEEMKKELPEPFTLMYKAKKQSKATPHQVERLKEYRKRFGIEDEIAWEILTRSEASRLQDKYYATYGR